MIKYVKEIKLGKEMKKLRKNRIEKMKYINSTEK